MTAQDVGQLMHQEAVGPGDYLTVTTTFDGLQEFDANSPGMRGRSVGVGTGALSDAAVRINTGPDVDDSRLSWPCHFYHGASL